MCHYILHVIVNFFYHLEIKNLKRLQQNVVSLCLIHFLPTNTLPRPQTFISCVYVLLGYKSAPPACSVLRTRRRLQIPWDCSYRQLWVTYHVGAVNQNWILLIQTLYSLLDSILSLRVILSLSHKSTFFELAYSGRSLVRQCTRFFIGYLYRYFNLYRSVFSCLSIYLSVCVSFSF